MTLTKRDVVIMAATILMVIGGATGFVVTRKNAIAGSSTHAVRYFQFDSPRPFQVPETYSLNIFAEPSLSSQILVELPPKAIAFTIGAYGVAPDSAEWHKARTQSGSIGWYQADVREMTVQAAEQRILRDQQELESAVRSKLTKAVLSKIAEIGIHGGGPPDEIHFTAPLAATESTVSYRAPISAIMHGTIVSSNLYQVDLVVTLFLHVNKDHIPASTIEISDVEYLGYEQTSGFSGSGVAKLFSALGIF
jgi:hypothetical protein